MSTNTASMAPPTATVGIIGGGQLARMTQQAAIALGINVRVLTPDPDAPAVNAGATHHPGHHGDLEDLQVFARRCDVVTLDHEHTPNRHLHALDEAGHRLLPNPHAAAMAHDKVLARRTLRAAGFPVPDFVEVPAGDHAAVDAFASSHGWPLVLKAPTGGYDGRGVEILTSPGDLRTSPLGATLDRWLIEAAVPIATELSVLVARRPSGWWQTYPVIETFQHDGICRELLMPARISDHDAHQAVRLATSIANGLDIAGILAVELFLTPTGDLLINELATRPHNSGHATIDATITSQFENHLRGVLDWPLGATDLHRPAAATVNLLGPDHAVDLARTLPAALDDPAVRIHLYRKAPVPGRKLGHVTAHGDNAAAAFDAARRAARVLLQP